ncbi:aminopeptidase [Cohnella sp. CIP 111063]|uniref:aminopeptidase n=1 Tax=unclassified Cohnella TaxID=2636738 RepID=UPI000B8BF01E|nr:MULTISPECIES: aminopeptidase [unclassified Cohnella]OXS53082.1 aminopeptidase [Cohnella sp. CIP 111063]PRX60593.1 aminopeptidase [Cohnella sp. SGD-V74]
MDNFNKHLEQYAALAVEVGVNIQPGQPLWIAAPVAAAEFVREIAKHAYKTGAKYVHVDWNDDLVTRARLEHAAEESLSFAPAWNIAGRIELAEEGAAFLTIVSENPNALRGIDPARIALATKAQQQAAQPFRPYTLNNVCAWSIVAYPTQAWADKVFPELPEEERVAALWDAIFSATRAKESDPVRLWKAHAETLGTKAARLNERKYKELRYRAPGTDLTVGLPEEHIWSFAGKTNARGAEFIPNMPTEEVFGSPHRDRVNGTVSSSKPLSYGGKLIDNFSFTFKDGRIVDYTAEKEYETLKRLVETDEGSHYLGELALVPHRSPISDTNLIFYNTLFDENAACHLAIGFGFPFAVEGGSAMTKEQLAEKGINHSLTHVDFMIGRADLQIDGITEDGSAEPIFRDGNWAF